MSPAQQKELFDSMSAHDKVAMYEMMSPAQQKELFDSMSAHDKVALYKIMSPGNANERVCTSLNPDTKSVQLNSCRKCSRCDAELEHNKVHNCHEVLNCGAP